MSKLSLESPVSVLSGVGPVIEKGLHQLNIKTIKDLILYFPRRWEDFSKISKLKNIKPGRVAVSCEIEQINVRRSARNKRLTITEAILSDGTGTIKAVWFNQPYLVNTLKKDQTYLFSGQFEFKNNYLSLNSPTFEIANQSNNKGKIYSIYSENSIISSKIIQKLIGQVIHLCDEINDDLPVEFEKRYNLINYSKAVKNLHQPDDMNLVELAKERMSFVELFELVLTGLVIKNDIKTEVSPKIDFSLEVVESVLKQLSFNLTDAQRKVSWQIFKDLEKSKPMNRMLEGDVGSGKTMISLLAIAMTVNSGYQTALMVPTEILARQHLATFKNILNSLNIKCELLVAALKPSEKTKLQTNILNGDIQVVIGTHALLSTGVEFNKLGLIVIDEQHRFGVNQRRALKTKASFMPHVLTMTATPIPRSLALVVYGDLDVSIIDELPPGRKPVETKVVREIDRRMVYGFVDQLIQQGQQVFIICPSIAQNDLSGMKSLESEYIRLQKTVFNHRKIAMLHGKMKQKDKSKIMDDFRLGKYNILLATTVIEVGVDVPNATVLMVENAERFGLATLHQLRGRVGRSKLQSHCYLMSETDNPQSYNRLKALEKTNDGFRLAQIDLELRGPGEIYGQMQHGVLDLRFANVFDTTMLAKVREAAHSMVASENMLQYSNIVKRINVLKKLTSLD